MKRMKFGFLPRLLCGLAWPAVVWAQAGQAGQGGQPSLTALPGLPTAAEVQRALATTPALLALGHALGAEQAGARQLAAGPHEWTLGLGTERRRFNAQPQDNTQAWEVSLERAYRGTGKAEAAQQLGQARVARAQAEWAAAWREQTRQLLERQLSWLHEDSSAQAWARQAELLQQQAQAVASRQRLGDAAPLESLQAQAALQQAQAQAQAARARADTTREGLQRQFPGLPLLATAALAVEAQGAFAPTGVAGLPTAAFNATNLANATSATTPGPLEVFQTSSPELQRALLEENAALAAARSEAAERKPDATVAVRVGGARGESTLGLTWSRPFGGTARAAAADAAAARAAQATQTRLDTERRVAAEALQRWRDGQAAQASALALHNTAQAYQRAAQAVARAYALGEGSLSEVLAARRGAHEQDLAAQQAQADSLASALRWQLETGRLWPAPLGPSSAP